MVLAYVLINTKISKEQEVYEKLKEYSHVTDLVPVFGEYDLVAKLETKKSTDIADYVISIRKIPEVTNTKTLFGLKY